MRSSGNPGIRFRSEVPDNAAAAENIVLAALARIHIELRHARPEVSNFPAQAESPGDLHIKSRTDLEYTGVGSRFARVIASEEQGRTLCEMAESAAYTDPWRDSLPGKHA